MTGELLYTATGVSKRFGHVVALEDASVNIHAGEVVALVGDNGAGKSTLVKVLSGALSPDSGRITLDGIERQWSSPHDALAAGIETLYQDAGLAPDLSIAANYYLGRELFLSGVRGWLRLLDNKEMEHRANEALQRIGITVADPRRVVNDLSGGQKQAVAIGRAVAWARKIIILDEPTNHLGARQSAEVLNVINHARDQGLGVVLVSHVLPHVLDVSDRTVVMRLGRVVEDRPTAEFSADTLVKAITGIAVR